MVVLFFFNDTATTEIYTLSLHDALPISGRRREDGGGPRRGRAGPAGRGGGAPGQGAAGARGGRVPGPAGPAAGRDRESTRLNSRHANISYAVFFLKKKMTCVSLPVLSSH